MTYESEERRAIREERLAGFVDDFARLCKIELKEGVWHGNVHEHHDAPTKAHLANEVKRAEKWLTFDPPYQGR